MLSTEDAKPESNNRWKSDLGHVGRRFVGGRVSGYVWYLELSREPKHVAQEMRYQNLDLSNGHCLGSPLSRAAGSLYRDVTTGHYSTLEDSSSSHRGSM